MAETMRTDMKSPPTSESKPSSMLAPLAPRSSAPQTSAASSARPNRSPPRNAANEIVCNHPDCQSKKPQETFKRRCEYNKHMDRHERPYKCREPGRHLGEVAVHTPSVSVRDAIVAPTTATHKRKRLPTPHATEDEEGEEGFLTEHSVVSEIEAHSVVKALRTLLAQKDDIIHWQQMEIQKLQNIITNLPQQALYSINAASIVGLGGPDGGVGPSTRSAADDDASAGKVG
ncbi:hypothetical protein DV738_g312, partial [Chaetothyriales sp. CBS 135597]